MVIGVSVVKKENPMEFLNIVNAIASHITPQNIENMIALVEKLIILGEQMESAVQSSAAQLQDKQQ
jgi:hypothetical protein